MAQTNQTQSGSQTNFTFQLPAPTDFQRLQYYYAAYPSSPGPGAEHGIFTVGNNSSWNGDWNSTVVPAPTRTQLNAITPQQFDLFNRAGVFTNGAWEIATSVTNVTLSSLNPTASSYAQIRAAATHDQQTRLCQQLQQSSP
jgi:hypothetical protein